MQCFIYKCQKKDELYLYLRKQDDFSIVPDQLLASMGKLTFVMELELDSQRKLAREDVNKVMDSIQNKGFFVQMPPLQIPLAMLNSAKQLH